MKISIISALILSSAFISSLSNAQHPNKDKLQSNKDRMCTSAKYIDYSVSLSDNASFRSFAQVWKTDICVSNILLQKIGSPNHVQNWGLAHIYAGALIYTHAYPYIGQTEVSTQEQFQVMTRSLENLYSGLYLFRHLEVNKIN